MMRTLILFPTIILALLTPFALADEKLPAAVKEKLQKKISLDFTNAPLVSVMRSLSEKTGLNMILAPGFKLRGGDGKVSLSVAQLPAEKTLGLISHFNELTWVYRFGSLVIGSEKSLRAYPRARPVLPADATDAQKTFFAGLESKRITLDFTETPIADVLQFMSFVGNVMVTTVGQPKGGWQKITLRVRGLRLVDALCLAAAQSGGSIVWEKGGLVMRRTPSLTWKVIRTRILTMAQAPGADVARLKALLEQLKSEEFKERSTASAGIRQMGPKALEALLGLYETTKVIHLRYASRELLADISKLDIPSPDDIAAQAKASAVGKGNTQKK